DTIEKIPGVNNIHDLHVWSITSGKNALSGHVVIENGLSFEESQLILREIEAAMIKQQITHITIQLESQDHPHIESIHGD
ncbi:cation-efflux pump, partial [Streptococcus pneumoniae]|nr:cation-efflux pump [Streptococcus pneumoniae]